MKIKNVARICHEANKALCEGIGDFSQKPWLQAEQWQRDAAIDGVKFFLANSDAPDSVQHDAWIKDKIDAGWVYGIKKDSEAKTHPCLVPFEELPLYQQAKDTLFKAICTSCVPLITT